LKLAGVLVDSRLAACVQINGPGISTYHWQGTLEQSDEWYLCIKTATTTTQTVVDWLEQHHPYDVPEIIWSRFACNQAYADWVSEQLS